MNGNSAMFHRQENPLLHTAVIINDLVMLKNCLSMGMPVNGKNEKGETPLHCAIEYPAGLNICYKASKILISKGANVNESENSGQTPLHYICNRRYYQDCEDDKRLVDLLIENGADVNKKDLSSHTPLFLAVKANNFTLVKKLLQSGADPNLHGPNPIALQAIRNGNKKMLQLLLRYRANANDPLLIKKAMVVDKATRCDLLELLFENGTDFKKLYRNEEVRNYEYNYVFKRLSSDLKSEVLECALENRMDLCMKDFCIQKCVAEISRLATVRPNRIREYRDFVGTVSALLKHMIVLAESEEISLHNGIPFFYNGPRGFMEQLERYKSQIERMKRTKVIEHSNVTYFDLLIKRGKVLTGYCNNEVSLAMQKDLKQLFPDFADKLRRNFRRGFLERMTREKLNYYLFEILKPRVTFDIACYIGDFLDMSDLTVFKLEADRIDDFEIFSIFE